jgi:large repetitive protein
MPTELGPHNLTSDASNPPFVVSASSEVNSSWQAWQAFDGVRGGPSSTDGWGSANSSPAWLQIDLGSGQLLGSYAIETPGNQGTGVMPNTWTMEGSNDGATWSTVDTQTGITWTAGQTQTFTCFAPGTWRYYRLNVTANNGGSYVMIAELDLFEGTLGTTPQTITFPAISNHTNTDAPFALAATSDSSLGIAYTVVSGPATVSGNTVSVSPIDGIGLVTIQAAQGGNATYAAASPVTQTFTVTGVSDFAPHNLTGDQNNPPYIVSESSTWLFGDFQGSCAFDGSPANAWVGAWVAGVAWLQLGIGFATTLAGYAIQTSLSGAATAANAPNAWTMQGSVDGVTWVVLDTQTGQSGWGAGTIKSYTLSAVSAAYRYFKVVVTANNGDTSYVQIAELYLFGTPVSQVDLAPHNLTSNTSTPPYVASCSSFYSSNDAFKAFDGLSGVSGTGMWQCGGVAGWLQIDLGTAATVRGYSILATGNGGVTGTLTGMPQAWSLEGSNDGVAWDVLDTQTYSAWSVYQLLHIDLSGSTPAYRYYRLNITANNGASLTNIAEFYLFEGATSTAQTIAFPAIPGHADTDAPFALAATASSGLTVSYAVTSGPATVSGNTVTLTGGLGTVTIQATQAGNGSFAAATPVNQSFTVSTAVQTITFASIPAHLTTDAPLTLAPSASSGLTVSLAVTSGPATIVGYTVTLTGAAGTVTIQATQAGNGTYAAAAPVNQSFTVSLTPQTITFGTIPGHVANDPPSTLAPTASSGLAVSLAVTSGPATIVGDVVTFTGAAGTVTIQATQAGNGTYAAATPVSQSFAVAASQRGNIAYDQIRTADRTGNGPQLLTYTTPPPASATSAGTPGQVAFDAAGNWYFCYGVNQWGRIGPTGYGSAAASPPSW